jgi:hypothetical protein
LVFPQQVFFWLRLLLLAAVVETGRSSLPFECLGLAMVIFVLFVDLQLNCLPTIGCVLLRVAQDDRELRALYYAAVLPLFRLLFHNIPVIHVLCTYIIIGGGVFGKHMPGPGGGELPPNRGIDGDGGGGAFRGGGSPDPRV